MYLSVTSVSLSARLPVRPGPATCLCPSVCLLVYVRPSVYLSMSVRLSTCLCPSVCLLVYVRPSVYLSVSVRPSVYLSTNGFFSVFGVVLGVPAVEMWHFRWLQ